MSSLWLIVCFLIVLHQMQLSFALFPRTAGMLPKPRHQKFDFDKCCNTGNSEAHTEFKEKVKGMYAECSQQSGKLVDLKETVI